MSIYNTEFPQQLVFPSRKVDLKLYMPSIKQHIYVTELNGKVRVRFVMSQNHLGTSTVVLKPFVFIITDFLVDPQLHLFNDANSSNPMEDVMITDWEQFVELMREFQGYYIARVSFVTICI